MLFYELFKEILKINNIVKYSKVDLGQILSGKLFVIMSVWCWNKISDNL